MASSDDRAKLRRHGAVRAWHRATFLGSPACCSTRAGGGTTRMGIPAAGARFVAGVVLLLFEMALRSRRLGFRRAVSKVSENG